MFSLNLPTTQDCAKCCLFGIFKVANWIENAGQSMMSGTQSWDRSWVCSRHYIWQQEIRQPVGNNQLFTHRCQKTPYMLKLGFFPSRCSERQAEIKPGFLNQILSTCTIVPTSSKVLTEVLLLCMSWKHLPIWTTPHFFGVTSHVTYTAVREVPVVLWSHQYNVWTLLQEINVWDSTVQP